MDDLTNQDEAQSPERLLSYAKKMFETFADAESDNRRSAEEDMAFVEVDEAQWPAEILEQRSDAHQPCLTMNRLKPLVRQVVNDARQAKPSIKVRPADDTADPETAELINGLIRNIEYTSNADVAYDTAIESSVIGGVGYWRVNIDYAFDDSFDADLMIERIPNALSVYRDAHSTAADSSDWNDCFIVERMAKEEFERSYPQATQTNWDGGDWTRVSEPWVDTETVLVCEWWHRDIVTTQIIQLSNGLVVDEQQLYTDPDLVEIAELVDLGYIQVTNRRPKKAHRVIRRIMTAAEIIEEYEWPGSYIPIVPVYGDEFWHQGKRQLRGLVHHAKDAQRAYNYWVSQAAYLVALAPKAPWVGPEGFAATDPNGWATSNRVAHPYLEYGPDVNGNMTPPQRMPLDSGPAAGALQQASVAAQDIMDVVGIQAPALGVQGPQESGIAVNARRSESDNSTFHFVDNLSRAIRHTGRILIDLIPKIYTGERMVRVVGEDGEPENKQLGVPTPAERQNPQTGQMETILRLHDLSRGRYDLTVAAGPSYSTKRQEAVQYMTEWARNAPQIAPMMFDLIAKNQDWPGADELEKRLKAAVPPQVRGEGPTQREQQMMAQMKQMGQAMQMAQQKIQQLEAEKRNKIADHMIDAEKVATDRYEAVTGRMKAQADLVQPQIDRAMAAQQMQQVGQYRPMPLPPGPRPMRPPPQRPAPAPQPTPPPSGVF